jgi:DNA-binding NtrC family response regulator
MKISYAKFNGAKSNYLEDCLIDVCVVSPEIDLHQLLAPALGAEFRTVGVKCDADCIQQRLTDHRVDVVVLDLDADQDIGKQVKCYTLIHHLGIPVVALVADNARSVAIDLLQRGLHGYCRRPPAIRELRSLIIGATRDADLKRRVKGRTGQIVPPAGDIGSHLGLIGTSAEIKAVNSSIQRIAELNIPVLIVGESGTGKELIARAIHNNSHRSVEPFVAVSCGGIPEDLLESELFGDDESNGEEPRTGSFELAGKGTVLLDEIGDLGFHAQVRLLNAIDQRAYLPLGRKHPVPVHARMIFTTNRDLQELVTLGKFRSDLY